ncbi:MAG TPA: efflux RND transporter periplasmic adaptor subunit [Methylovorus sp.]|nr:efflux RND transporter periplasmic adaptor subunit [Methylovorus sp.]
MNAASPRFNRKLIWLALGLALIGTAGVLSHTSQAARPAATAAAPAPVTVATVIEKSVIEWDEFSGRVEAVEYVEIRPRVSGTIDVIHFRDGQLVKKGDLLFTIDPRPFQAELARTEAEKASAEAALELARTEQERTRRLIEDRAVAQRELDERNNTYLVADARLKAAEAAVMTARLNLQYTAITAPVSGRVSHAEITVGNLVGPANATALTTLVSVSPMYVNFEVDEQTYGRYLAHGAGNNAHSERIPVAIGLASETGYPHQGQIRAFDNRLDTASGTIRVRAVLDNQDGALTPGMYARVRTGGGGEKPALLIDDKAIGTDQDKKFVMVVDADNKALYRPIKIGPMVEGMRIVREGLSAGEHIIVNGLQRVRPNDVVAPTPVAESPAAPTAKSASLAPAPTSTAAKKIRI